jgi:hypothetical protein
LNQESSPERLAFQVAHTTISPELSGRRVRNPRSPDLGRLCRCTTARQRNRRAASRACVRM